MSVRPDLTLPAWLSGAAATGHYGLRLARDEADIRAAQSLRFEVFNLELGEGLARSYECGRDADPFDAVCDHLLVEDRTDGGRVVGTYRLQTGLNAARHHGYYCQTEFDCTPFEPFRPQILELGRACVARGHRHFNVLNLLWQGIASYAKTQGARYLLGCSSLTSQDPRDGAAVHRRLLPHAAPPAWQTRPLDGLACPLEPADTPGPAVPKLMAAYLALGAGICGPPAIDRAFGTIDFLTWLDLQGDGARHWLARRARASVDRLRL